MKKNPNASAIFAILLVGAQHAAPLLEETYK